MKKYAAIIVETRELGNLGDVIQNHLDYLPDGWELHVIGSAQNEKGITHRFPDCKFMEIDYFQFLRDHGKLPHINANQYNRLLTYPGFWERYIDYERVLIFQSDSTLLREGIERFLEWDYIGAPWIHINLCGGNGGLSLRNPKKMLELCELKAWEPSEGNEDVYFSKHLNMIGGFVACQGVAKQFSVETIFYPTPIGCHAPEKYLHQSQLKELYK